MFPALLVNASEALGLQVPTNLLFFIASLVLLILTLQHSYELGRLEEQTRTLAEEVALLRLALEEQDQRAAGSRRRRRRRRRRRTAERRDAVTDDAPLDVFIPYWGDPGLLYATVESVRAQTDPRWRATVVDDCYPDPSVAEHFAAEDDPRIRYLRNEQNLGITANYDRCRELAERRT